MVMTQFPEIKDRPTLKETIIDLLESIALEETAIANVIKAEAKKIQAFLGKKGDFPTNPTNEDIFYFNQGISRILETILMKEWILLKKLETVISIENKKFGIRNENAGKGSEPVDKKVDVPLSAQWQRFGDSMDWYDNDEFDGEE